jgi:hypothetical protein
MRLPGAEGEGMTPRKWYEFDPEAESLEECRDRRLMQCPMLTSVEIEQLKQLLTATWDGNLCSKLARSSLIGKGLAVKFDGWQVISAEGLAVLHTLNGMPRT